MPVATYLIEAFRLNQRKVCYLLRMSRTAYRYTQQQKTDETLRMRLKPLAAIYRRYGYI